MRYDIKTNDSCRLCGGNKLRRAGEIPPLPLAGRPVTRAAAEAGACERYPVSLFHCAGCGLLQLTDVVSAGIYENYLYTPAHSEAFAGHCRKLARALREKYAPARAVEIGCGCGTLLKCLVNEDIRATGYEPAANLAAAASAEGLDVVNDYFTEKTAFSPNGPESKADLVVIRHVLEHIDDFSGILGPVSRMLGGDGIFVIEVPDARNIVGQNQYYSIFHEHLNYFTLRSLNSLLKKYGFFIYEAEEVFPEGGSLLVTAGRERRGDRFDDLCRSGRFAAEGKDEPEGYYSGFFATMNDCVDKFKGFVRAAKEAGTRLAAWGAGQRGITLLNLCGTGPDAIAYVIDSNPHYAGLFTPGPPIPIVGPEALKTDPVGGVVIFATGYAGEIRESCAWFEKAGGRFATIIPEPRWLD